MLEIKQVGNRYYYYSRMQMRSFPIKKSEALTKIANNEAYMVERFITDPSILEDVTPAQPVEEDTTPSNVISFTNRLQAKQEENSLIEAKNHFLNEILPNMKLDEMKKLMESTTSNGNFNEELMRITLRISIDKAIN